MDKIIGNTVGVPNPQPDWNQTDKRKADYIKNKPDVLKADEDLTLTNHSIHIEKTPDHEGDVSLFIDAGAKVNINGNDITDNLFQLNGVVEELTYHLDHSTNNPHNVTAEQIGLGDIDERVTTVEDGLSQIIGEKPPTFTFAQGGMSSSDGKFTGETNTYYNLRIYTEEYYKCKPYTVSVEPNYSYDIYYYDENKGFIDNDKWYSDASVVKTSVIKDGKSINVGWIRFIMKSAFGAISPDEGSTLSITLDGYTEGINNEFRENVTSDLKESLDSHVTNTENAHNVTAEQVGAISKQEGKADYINVSNDDVGNMATYIKELNNKVLGVTHTVNLIPTSNTWTDGYIKSDGSYNSTQTSFSTSDYIPVLPNRTISATRLKNEAGDRMKDGMCTIVFYDTDKNVLSIYGGKATPMSQKDFVSPATTRYCRISVVTAYLHSNHKYMLEYSDNDIASTYSAYKETEYVVKQATGLAGKKICAFGDSLAACGTSGNDAWINRVGNYFGCSEVYNRGICGSTVTKTKEDGTERVNYSYVNSDGEAYSRSQYSTQQDTTADKFAGGGYTTEITPFMETEARCNTIPTDTDVVIIVAGVNDYGTTNEEHFGTAYRQMLTNIQNRVPNADIYICPWSFHVSGDANGQTMFNSFEKYRNVIKKIAYEYSYNIIDLRGTMGVNANNYLSYMSDNVHYQTEAGKQKWTKCMIESLKNYM